MLEVRRPQSSEGKVLNESLFYKVDKSRRMVAGIGVDSQVLKSLMNERKVASVGGR